MDPKIKYNRCNKKLQSLLKLIKCNTPKQNNLFLKLGQINIENKSRKKLMVINMSYVTVNLLSLASNAGKVTIIKRCLVINKHLQLRFVVICAIKSTQNTPPFSTLVIFLAVINQKLVLLVLEKPIATGRYLTMSGDTILKMKK